MHYYKNLLTILGAGSVLAFVTVAANAQAVVSADHVASPAACQALVHMHFDHGLVTSAKWVKSGTSFGSDKGAALTGAAKAIRPFPAHCVAEAAFEKRTGADGKPYEIRMEIRLPAKWNGRSLYQGGGGMDGIVRPALGTMPIHNSTAEPALSRGYVVYSTDSGHQGKNSNDSEFGLDQQARLNYAYAAIGKVSDEAKRFIRTFYHRDAETRYFMGCSNGGREALMAAQRFPTKFDAVLACNPGFHLSRASIAQAWDVQAFMKVAPEDKNGRKVLANALTPADMKLLSNAILKKCDGLDGLKDGEIDAMSECRFDPAVLTCKGGKTAACLSPVQVAAIKTVFGGAHDSHGNRIYSTWPYDAGISSDAWRRWKLGTSQDGAKPNALNATLGVGSLSLYFSTPVNRNLDTLHLNFDKIVAPTQQTAAINDATGTMYSSFIAHGGKLLVIQGNSDPVFSADDLRAYWRELEKDNGGAAATAKWARLFIVPGMNHCGDGPAMNDFDPLTALENWAQHGHAPARILARGKSFPGRTRPLCAFPSEAHYDGHGNPKSAASFSCQMPK